jgi:hypothetical protein
MSRGAQAFKQGDITRAIKATVNAGQHVQRVEVDRMGKIVVIIGEPGTGEPSGRYDWADVK